MYIAECLARERQAEWLRRAAGARTARQVAELARLEKRRKRAERELLLAWQRVDQLRARLGYGG